MLSKEIFCMTGAATLPAPMKPFTAKKELQKDMWRLRMDKHIKWTKQVKESWVLCNHLCYELISLIANLL